MSTPQWSVDDMPVATFIAVLRAHHPQPAEQIQQAVDELEEVRRKEYIRDLEATYTETLNQPTFLVEVNAELSRNQVTASTGRQRPAPRCPRAKP